MGKSRELLSLPSPVFCVLLIGHRVSYFVAGEGLSFWAADERELDAMRCVKSWQDPVGAREAVGVAMRRCLESAREVRRVARGLDGDEMGRCGTPINERRVD